jgi:hypothetical protein
VRGERQTDVTCGRASPGDGAPGRPDGRGRPDGAGSRVRGFAGSRPDGLGGGLEEGRRDGGTGGRGDGGTGGRGDGGRWPGGVVSAVGEVSAVGGGREGGSRGAGVRGQRIVEDQASRHYRRTGKWPRQVTERIGAAASQPLPYRGAPAQCIGR